MNKLVRDKVLDDMQNLKQRVEWHKLDDIEYLPALAKKLVEEAQEFSLENSEAALKELADVMEVIESIAAEYGADWDKLRAVQADIRAKRGGFHDRVYVERLDLDDDDPWVKYYAASPDRFREITNDTEPV
ncbi:MAG: nucleoside triphosphate pyrophosphohydrolase [Candidatus Saccharibacteria bacterium]